MAQDRYQGSGHKVVGNTEITFSFLRDHRLQWQAGYVRVQFHSPPPVTNWNNREAALSIWLHPRLSRTTQRKGRCFSISGLRRKNKTGDRPQVAELSLGRATWASCRKNICQFVVVMGVTCPPAPPHPQGFSQTKPNWLEVKE